MSKQDPEYLERLEPKRVPIKGFKFEQEKTGKAEREAGLFQGECLARDLAMAKGNNTASDVTRNNTTYGDRRTLEDGTTERLIGCSSCGAMCTLITAERKGSGPGTEDDPNNVISVAEAPQPNPWMELGNFGDCKIGEIRLPEPVEGLTQSLGLTDTQKLMAKVLTGNID
jgi:hypothetical protein